MAFLTLLILLNGWIQAVALTAADSRALPDLDSFLKDIRNNLHSDRVLQSRYTYTENLRLRELDSGGNVKKTETRTYEVYPSLEERMTYRRLISKNDKPLSEREIQKNDREFEKRRSEFERESPDKRKRREEETFRKEEEARDEAFLLYSITMEGREQVDGIPVIALRFAPRPGFKPKTREGKILAKVQGRALFSEEDKELVRIEAELQENLSLGLGFAVRLNRGMRLVFQRRRVNDEVWLPAVAHFTGTGRFLLFKGFRVDQEMVYSDYRKFSVESGFKIQGLE